MKLNNTIRLKIGSTVAPNCIRSENIRLKIGSTVAPNCIRSENIRLKIRSTVAPNCIRSENIRLKIGSTGASDYNLAKVAPNCIRSENIRLKIGSTMEDLLYNVEQKWLKTLFQVCRDTFSDSFLPSHDETHHYRVWLIARELISELGTHDIHFSETDIEKILIAVFFHDVGMAKNLDKEHGKISREICEDFFKRNPNKIIKGLKEVYEAIEKHDDKEYKNNIQFPMKPTNLFFILSVSDDLDAFGIIGIYRYAEIYLLRNININDLPEKVLDNLNSRFDYFQKNYGFLVRFAEKQKARYLTIKSFYEALQKQLTDKAYSSSIRYGPLGVINFIIQFVLERKLSPEVISEHFIKNAEDLFVKEFFEQFDMEMLTTHPRNKRFLMCYFTKKSSSNSSSM